MQTHVDVVEQGTEVRNFESGVAKFGSNSSSLQIYEQSTRPFFLLIRNIDGQAKLKMTKKRQSKDKGREMESKSGESEGEEGDCNDTGQNFKAIRFHFPDKTPSLRCHCPAQRLHRHLHSVCSACT